MQVKEALLSSDKSSPSALAAEFAANFASLHNLRLGREGAIAVAVKVGAKDDSDRRGLARYNFFI